MKYTSAFLCDGELVIETNYDYAFVIISSNDNFSFMQRHTEVYFLKFDWNYLKRMYLNTSYPSPEDDQCSSNSSETYQ